MQFLQGKAGHPKSEHLLQDYTGKILRSPQERGSQSYSDNVCPNGKM
jgi:hypothetical protein